MCFCFGFPLEGGSSQMQLVVLFLVPFVWVMCFLFVCFGVKKTREKSGWVLFFYFGWKKTGFGELC